MSHARTQIREAAATALKDAGTALDKNYFVDQYFAMPTERMPGATIRTHSENNELHTSGRPRTLWREFNMVISVYASSTSDIDTTLDGYCAEIEAVLGNSTLSGLVKDMVLVTTNYAVESGDKPYGRAQMIWQVVYRTAENDAEVFV